MQQHRIVEQFLGEAGTTGDRRRGDQLGSAAGAGVADGYMAEGQADQGAENPSRK